MGPPSATAALSALTLFSRPTWSGTIISGKMTVSRSATRGRSRTPIGVSTCGSSTGLDGRLAIVVVLLTCGVFEGRGCCCGLRFCAVPASIGGVAGPFGIERLEDAGAEALLELEEDADAREVHA